MVAPARVETVVAALGPTSARPIVSWQEGLGMGTAMATLS